MFTFKNNSSIGLMYELKEVSAKRITLISKISFKLKTEIS